MMKPFTNDQKRQKTFKPLGPVTRSQKQTALQGDADPMFAINLAKIYLKLCEHIRLC